MLSGRAAPVSAVRADRTCALLPPGTVWPSVRPARSPTRANLHFRGCSPRRRVSLPTASDLRKRRSVRNYTDEQVSEEEIMRLSRRPCSLRPQRAVRCFTIIQTPGASPIRRRIAQYTLLSQRQTASASSCSAWAGRDRGHRGARGARPLLEDRRGPEARRPALLGAPRSWSHSRRGPDRPRSARYAVANFMLMATTMGLGTCVIGFLTAAAEQDPRVREPSGLTTLDAALSSIPDVSPPLG